VQMITYLVSVGTQMHWQRSRRKTSDVMAALVMAAQNRSRILLCILDLYGCKSPDILYVLIWVFKEPK
jgi:hypothetical protein